MKIHVLILLAVLAVITACSDVVTTAYDERVSGFAVGDTKTTTIGGVTFVMSYVPDKIIFPMGITEIGTGYLDNSYWICQTEVTNALFAAVLQWAYINGRFTITNENYNGYVTDIAKYGGKALIRFTPYPASNINHSGGNFSSVSGKENLPVTGVFWYGAIMFCNWITEMRDGNSSNVVYSGMDSTWDNSETVVDVSKSGYRLPSNAEWECAARWVGTSAGGRTDLVSRRTNGGSAGLTPGYYWTPGDYASGAMADYNNMTANQFVAVYDYTDPNPYSEPQNVMSLGPSSANALGLYDMSGNAPEWMFDADDIYTLRYHRGGWFSVNASYLQVGALSGGSVVTDEHYPGSGDRLGFRIVRTQ
ncbi:MAG TPA: SUMF1/EgtB/PvdO family nonheme iron enzyme [Spirochaetota bacterium]|nr:SUMF1/EgtB/PvdO family nonheme iron enzyme [Spirochaetota bacterium]